MPHHRPTFTEEFLAEARRLVPARTQAAHRRQRARLVLLLHEQPSIANAQAATQFDLHPHGIRRWGRLWANGRRNERPGGEAGRLVWVAPVAAEGAEWGNLLRAALANSPSDN
jgi:hypothetical protein